MFIKLVLLCLIFSCANNHRSKSILDKVIKTKQLKVGTTFDYAPFSYRDENNGPAGLDIERAHKLARSLGAKVIFVETTWKNLIRDLKQHKFDIAMGGISKNLQRQQTGFFTHSYLNNGKMPISLCKNKFKFNKIKKIDSAKTKLIVNSGGTNYSFVKNNIKNARVIIHPDNNSIFEKIINGEADVMISDSAEVAFQAKKHLNILCPTLKKPLTTGSLAYLVPRDIVWKEYVNAWLDSPLNL